MLSQSQGKGNKDSVHYGPLSEAVKPSPDTTVSKPESAREQNDGVLRSGHLGFPGWWKCREGEPGGVTITVLPSATFKD